MADHPPGPPCGHPHPHEDLLNLRIASVFVLLVASTAGALFPILIRPSKNSRHLSLLFDFAKYFGSGVIIATAFVHLLAPSFASLSSECLHGTWQQYQWAPALAMMAVFALFFAELFAFRIGTQRLERLQAAKYDTHGHNVGDHGAMAAHGPEMGTPSVALAEPKQPGGVEAIELNSAAAGKSAASITDPKAVTTSTADLDLERAREGHHGHGASLGVINHAVLAHLVGIAILEFGVVFHSVLVGLALAVDKEFRALFIVITLHQTFEGLGLGARLASLELPGRYQRWVPLCGALMYGITTPIGIAVGLAVRGTYAPDAPIASVVSGIFDAISAGILLYTGLVELLAHEFLFNPNMSRISNKRLLFACGSMMLGAALMALLGRWA
ncbi:ZIP zinc/iron transport family [Exidia glandulosa HHB12029]|nr:ZIP zinc/iron transport family [Exidia glandulosa HHB12029]KZV92003.1 ZIP zinc/iron transport family [Exidia glandulosa HHB12029]